MTRCLEELLIAHPKGGLYPEGTFLGNSSSLRVRRYLNTAREKWGPAIDSVAMFFTLAPLNKKDFDEILQKVAKKQGIDVSLVNTRDKSNQKRLFFEEYDRVTSAKGHTQFEHLKIATDCVNLHDLKETGSRNHPKRRVA